MSATELLARVEDCNSRFGITFFANYGASRKTEAQYSLSELRQTILETTAPSKEALPWLKLAVFGEDRTDKGSLRHDQNVVSVTGAEADYDAARVEFQDAVARLHDIGILCLVYTSPSHTEDGHRWRVLCPFSRPLEPSERPRMLARLNGLFNGAFARESWTLSQSYFYGSVNSSSSHQAEVIEGDAIDLRDDLDAGAIGKPKPNGSAPKEPTGPVPVSSHPPDERLKRRYNGLFDALLDNIRNAPDQQKHHTLRDNSAMLGGHIAHAGITEAEAVEMLVGALPASVKDWNLARRTARDGLKWGMEHQCPPLEDRPGYSHGNRPPPPGPPPEPPSDDPAYTAPQEAAALPVIRLEAGELHTSVTASEAAIMAAGRPIYQRGIMLVRPIERDVAASQNRTIKVAALGEMNAYSVLDELSATADWQRYDGRSKDWKATNPPILIANILLNRQGKWHFKTIAGVITCPTLRPDGSILSAPGYDASTQLYHVVDPELTIRVDLLSPSREQALSALDTLCGLLADFPFVTIEEPGKPHRNVSRSVALSGLITPVVRAAMKCAPLHCLRAPTAGSGKSFYVDLASGISTGRPCPVMNADKDDSETEKRLTGLLLSGCPIISIDNVNGELGGNLLNQAIERPLIKLRQLGGSDMFEIDNTVTMFTTGNNVRVRGDMVRRTLMADMDAKVERPELREFKRNPFNDILADRGLYVSAALVIVRAYIAAGKPGCLPPVASFGEWSDLVRSALVWLGCEDPVQSMEAARAEDPELGELTEMLELWAQAFGSNAGMTLRDAVQAAVKTTTQMGEPASSNHPDLLEAFQRTAGRNGTIDTRTLGKWLLSREGRPVAGWRFKRFGTASGGVIRWGVETLR